MLFFLLINPVNLEPVIWSVRVTVKLILGTLDGASACCLVHKRLRHQGDLIEEHSSQCNTLNQILAAFILTTEDVEVVCHLSPADLHQVICPMICYLIAPAPEHQLQPEEDVPPE